MRSMGASRAAARPHPSSASAWILSTLDALDARRSRRSTPSPLYALDALRRPSSLSRPLRLSVAVWLPWSVSCWLPLPSRPLTDFVPTANPPLAVVHPRHRPYSLSSPPALVFACAAACPSSPPSLCPLHRRPPPTPSPSDRDPARTLWPSLSRRCSAVAASVALLLPASPPWPSLVSCAALPRLAHSPPHSAPRTVESRKHS